MGRPSIEVSEGAQGTSVVVKLTPDLSVAAHEAAGSSAWADCAHVVRLLDADLQRGALMLEHLPDASSLAIAAWSIPDVLPVLGELRAGDPLMGAGLPSLRDRVGFVFDLTARRALVHGDLHPGNVLATGSARCAIRYRRRWSGLPRSLLTGTAVPVGDR